MSISAWLLLPLASAQTSPVLTVTPPQNVTAKRGGGVDVKLAASLPAGFHANSNTPAESYLIPLRLTWTPGPLQVANIEYPKPQMQKYDFSDKPLSVVSGNFDVVTKFKVPQTAAKGPVELAGKLRFQACNDRACFPPKSVEVKVSVNVE